MNIEAIVFDFDGVIVDSEPLHCAAFQSVLQPLGIHFTWEEYLRDYVGFDDRDALRFAFSRHETDLSDDQMNVLIAKKATEFARLASTSDVVLYPGVMELLATFSGAIPLAICSGALRQDIEPVLERFNIQSHFPTIVTADQVDRSKPDPESYRKSFELMQQVWGPLNTDRCIAIEDTPAGITSAKGAGLYTVAVTHTHSDDVLTHADCIITSLTELVAALKQDGFDA